MKIEEAADHINVKAFLRAIRLGEGTLGDMGYNTIVGGQIFTDFSKHPGVRVYLPKYDVWSTAAGAYQIIKPTWGRLLYQYKFPDFSPRSQDLAAIALIDGRRALDEVINGQLYNAISKCAKEWASLPGSTAGQRIEKMEEIEKVYWNSGGTMNGTR